MRVLKAGLCRRIYGYGAYEILICIGCKQMAYARKDNKSEKRD
jgi:hypothetical protein